MLWKPVVWREHYSQWVTYPSREAPLPRQGAQVRLDEHPTETYVATRVETGVVSALVWLRLLGQEDE
jgi:hypothetical protein